MISLNGIMYIGLVLEIALYLCIYIKHSRERKSVRIICMGGLNFLMLIIINQLIKPYFYNGILVMIGFVIYFLFFEKREKMNHVYEAEILALSGISSDMLFLLGWNLFTNNEDAILFENHIWVTIRIMWHLLGILSAYLLLVYSQKKRSYKVDRLCFLLSFDVGAIALLLQLNLSLPSYPQFIKTYLYLLSFVFIVFSIASIISFSSMEKFYEEKMTLQEKVFQYECERKSFVEQEKYLGLMRRWKHDEKNHFIVVEELLGREKNCEAKEYIRELIGKMEEDLSFINSGNYILDAILQGKMNLVNANDIKFDYQVVWPQDYIIDGIDLNIILSNLLDNAIEGNIKLEKEKFINLKICPINNAMLIQISNAFSGEVQKEEGVFKTSKKGNGHGIGLKNVENIVENMEGIIDYNVRDNIFEIKILLPYRNGEIAYAN